MSAKTLTVEIRIDGVTYSRTTINRDGTRHGFNVRYVGKTREKSWNTQFYNTTDPDQIAAMALLARISEDIADSGAAGESRAA